MDHMKTGGPAFGTVISLDCVRVEMDGSMEYEPKVEPGNLTVRDYFAAKAMQSLIMRSVTAEDWQNIGATAYLTADHMLNERAK